MCAGMADLKKALTKITELEEELKATRDGYAEEITTLLEKSTTRILRYYLSDMWTPRRAMGDDQYQEG